jgi:hypothetical protein
VVGTWLPAERHSTVTSPVEKEVQTSQIGETPKSNIFILAYLAVHSAIIDRKIFSCPYSLLYNVTHF